MQGHCCRLSAGTFPLFALFICWHKRYWTPRGLESRIILYIDFSFAQHRQSPLIPLFFAYETILREFFTTFVPLCHICSIVRGGGGYLARITFPGRSAYRFSIFMCDRAPRSRERRNRCWPIVTSFDRAVFFSFLLRRSRRAILRPAVHLPSYFATRASEAKPRGTPGVSRARELKFHRFWRAIAKERAIRLHLVPFARLVPFLTPLDR